MGNHICITFLLLIFILSCKQPEGEGRTFSVKLSMPGEFSQASTEGTEIKLINTRNGTIYRSKANAAGVAEFSIEYGIYNLYAQLNWQSQLFSAGRENLPLTPVNGESMDILALALINSRLSNIVIKEIYYSGCLDENNKSYTKDAYLSLYNNSGETQWLDGLCVGIAGPATTAKVSSWLTFCPDSIAISFIGWQFPGSGTDYPLQPGEETILAINAVDHTGGKYNHANSINLSKADWGFYSPDLSMADIAPGVTPLNMFKKIGAIQNYVLTLSGPGVVLYHIADVSAGEYAANPNNLRKEPPQNNGLEHIMIPNEWVIDCVDCVKDASQKGNKRFPSFLDAEAVFLPSGTNSGRSLHRKIASESPDGRIVYQDSNNSANDFEERIPSVK